MNTENSASPLNPEQWVDNHGNYLFRFALARLRNSELAENVVQETFLAALKAHKTFSGKSSERTWLVGILKHKIIDHLRQSYREKPITDLQSEERAINDFFDQEEHLKKTPSHWIPEVHILTENAEFWEAFEDCLKKLPKATADAFALKEIDNVTSKEICKLLEITTTNLWVMLHRARLHLRQCLEKNWFESSSD